jgi:hypothetical protein
MGISLTLGMEMILVPDQIAFILVVSEYSDVDPAQSSGVFINHPVP